MDVDRGSHTCPVLSEGHPDDPRARFEDLEARGAAWYTPTERSRRRGSASLPYQSQWDPEEPSAGDCSGDDPIILTKRETDVMRLLADGCSAAAIAQRMGYSESTIKHVIFVVMRRIGAKNRTHAVAIAIRSKAI